MTNFINLTIKSMRSKSSPIHQRRHSGLAQRESEELSRSSLNIKDSHISLISVGNNDTTFALSHIRDRGRLLWLFGILAQVQASKPFLRVGIGTSLTSVCV